MVIIDLPQVILIRGLPGSGKTTLARMLSTPQTIHLEADDWFTHKNTGVYEFKPHELSKAHEHCQDRFRAAIRDPQILRIIVSNTFTQLWELQPYLTICDVYKINPQIIHCEGRFQNIHGVPTEKIEQMRARWEMITS